MGSPTRAEVGAALRRIVTGGKPHVVIDAERARTGQGVGLAGDAVPRYSLRNCSTFE
jgi:hypothetical protein